MWLSYLQLQNFRNYSELEVVLKQGMTLFHGPNGEGKTNLAEAIYFSSTLSSHRVAGYQNLISKNQPTSQLGVRTKSGSRELQLGLELNAKSSNRYFVNGNQVKKTSDVAGIVTAVMFAPEDLDLVRRDPADRRSFLDQALTQLKPRLIGVKTDYERVLKQRNALLKSAKGVKNPELSTLEIWDEQLIQYGVEIILQRLALIRAITPLINTFYQSLSASSEAVALTLVSPIGEDDELGKLPENKQELAELFRSRLISLRNKEFERGITLVGPHRDELLIEKDGLTARTHASQGEAWSLALGLKLALASLLKESSGGVDPILLLDDVFAVLDVGRRARLLEFVMNYEQVIVTAADKDMAPDLDWADVFLVSEGELTREN